MTRYTSSSPADRAAMLEAVGVDSAERLFDSIPGSVRLDGELDIPPGISEAETWRHLSELASRNVSTDGEVTFMGAGMYDHYVPAIVDEIVSRSEFKTSYTPYQAEISQGNLQAIFEFQTAISELTGLPVANASLYDGASAAAEAAHLAQAETGRGTVVVSRAVDPSVRAVLATLTQGYGTRIVEVPLCGTRTDVAALADAVDPDTAAVIVSQPNFLGSVEDLGDLCDVAKSCGALFVTACDPLTLGLLEAPGNLGADIVFGEGQTLGSGLSFGGPSFGFFAVAERLVRRLPGRVVGETQDRDGKRGWVLTLRTREQDIRRERATSNICTNQALNAVAAIVYLSWLGRQGIVDLGRLLISRTEYARKRLSEVDGVSLLDTGPVVREFAVKLDVPVDRLVGRCRAEGIACGYPLGREYPEFSDSLLVAITERRTRRDIDLLAAAMSDAVASERAFAEAPA